MGWSPAPAVKTGLRASICPVVGGLGRIILWTEPGDQELLGTRAVACTGTSVCEARPRVWERRYLLRPGLGLGAGQAPGSSPGPEAGRWVPGEVESKLGRGAGPSLPSSNNTRPALPTAPGLPPPSWLMLRPRSPVHSSPAAPSSLCFPSGEFLPGPSFPAVSRPYCSFPVSGRVAFPFPPAQALRLRKGRI